MRSRYARSAGVRPLLTIMILGASAFIIYQTTFISTPRLFLFPEVGIWSADIPEYAAALRGRPNEEDMRKHLLYFPVSRALYELANRARLRLGMNRDAAALIFPAALCGTVTVVLAYFLFRRFMGSSQAAVASAALYAFTYSVWIFSSVTESYAPTTFAVTLFFFFALDEDGPRRAGWYCAVTGLALICSLFDLRSLFLLAVPLYLSAVSGGIKRVRRVVVALLITVVVVALAGAAYEMYFRVSGRADFGIYRMWRWLGVLGSSERSVLSEGSSYPVSAGKVLFTFFVESISPLRQDYMEGSPAATGFVQMGLSSCFLAVSSVLLCGSYRRIWRYLRTNTALQGLACWLAVYSLFHVYYSPWSAGRLIFSNPLVLPLLLLLLPGVGDAWRERRGGVWLLCVAAVLLLANNLVLVNEARSAWQAPDIVQSPADRVYMLPGDPGRLNYLAHKGAVMLPAGERERFFVLAEKSGSQLTKDEWREINEIAFRAIGHLPEGERAEALDICLRNIETFRISEMQR